MDKKILNFTEDVLLFIAGLATLPAKAFLGTPYKGCPPLLHKQFYTKINRLKSAGYVNQQGESLKLTKRGEQKVQYLKWKIKKINIRNWDKRWRILSFDIPESKKRIRENLRKKLRNLNFIRLHDSLWVTPLPIENDIKELLKILEIKYFIRYMVVEKINFDGDLRKKFFN